MNPLFLVGFMASGKTTLGRALAADLGRTFIDTDIYLESRYRQTIPMLFSTRGEEGFRQLERTILHEVADFEDVVIATGGGMPCFGDNMAYMSSHGTTVHLVCPTDVILTRLRLSRTPRPLVAGKTDDELRAYIDATLAARNPFYMQAHHTFSSHQLESREQIATSVARFRRDILGDVTC